MRSVRGAEFVCGVGLFVRTASPAEKVAGSLRRRICRQGEDDRAKRKAAEGHAGNLPHLEGNEGKNRRRDDGGQHCLPPRPINPTYCRDYLTWQRAAVTQAPVAVSDRSEQVNPARTWLENRMRLHRHTRSQRLLTEASRFLRCRLASAASLLFFQKDKLGSSRQRIGDIRSRFTEMARFTPSTPTTCSTARNSQRPSGWRTQ